eukprot:scaffold38395_cov21-Prasinocladus_malaysianus.AAC.1
MSMQNSPTASATSVRVFDLKQKGGIKRKQCIGITEERLLALVEMHGMDWTGLDWTGLDQTRLSNGYAASNDNSR